MQSSSGSHSFPVFLSLKGRSCLIVGGGSVAARKAKGLLACKARVTVVSPEANALIRRWALAKRITWKRKKFSARELTGCLLVFAATSDSEVNEAVAELCRRRGILVNVADDPGLCDFTVPSVVRKKSLCLAIATGGKSPLLARRLREELSKSLPAAYAEFLELLGKAREKIKGSAADASRRRKVFESLVSSDILGLLKEGNRKKARERVRQCILSLQD